MTPGVLAAGLVAGLAITLVAALEPARRAAGVSPVTALRVRADPAAAARARTGWLVWSWSSWSGARDPAAARRSRRARWAPSAPSAVYVILLVAVLLTPVLLGPLGRLVGLPFALVLRLEERLARAAIARDRAGRRSPSARWWSVWRWSWRWARSRRTPAWPRRPGSRTSCRATRS